MFRKGAGNPNQGGDTLMGIPIQGGCPMLGIDVSKDTLHCTLMDPSTHAILFRRTLSNTEEGVRELLSLTPSEVGWVLEPTGRYSLLAARKGRAAGRQVFLAEPRKAKLYLQSLPRRAKTDTLDSQGLALYGLGRTLPLYPLKDAVVDQMDQMLKARKGMALSITSLRQRLPELPYAEQELRQAITDLEKQKAALDKKIAQLASTEERFQSARLLQSIPGVGPVTSAAVASCLAARGFNNPDQFVAFIGLDPSTHQSGQKDVHGSLTKRGDPELRRLLYLAAQSNLRVRDSPFRDIYQGHRDRGLSTTAALCAVARRIARTCWSIHKHQTTFQPARVQQQKDAPKSRPDHNPTLDTET